MVVLTRLLYIIINPRRTAQQILKEKKLTPALGVVIGFGLIFSTLSLISYFKGDYPPSPDELQTWIDAWGEFTMLPFLKIPAERYRLAQGLFFTPLVFAIWILMAGTARVFSIAWVGKGGFMEYLNLFAYSFFAFWILSSLLDMIYSGLLGLFVLNALRMAYGPAVRTVVASFPPVMYTTLLGMGGIYNGLMIHEREGFSLHKTILIGMMVFVWPIFLISILIR